MKASHVPNKLAHRFLNGVAQTLVRYANSIESYLAKERIYIKDPVVEHSIDVPPAHWLEKVRQGAPHLLDQISDGKETISPPHETNELDINQTSNSLDEQKNIVKKRNSGQQLVKKKSEKVFRSIKKQMTRTVEAAVKPVKKTEHIGSISSQKADKKTTQNWFNRISKIANIKQVETRSNLATPQKSKVSLQKVFNLETTKKKSISKNVTNGSLNKIEKKTKSTERAQNQAVEPSVHIRSSNKPTIHLYPKSKTQRKAIKFTQENQIIKAKDECNTFDFYSKDRKIQAPKTRQQHEGFLKNKSTVLLEKPNIQERKYKPQDTSTIQTEKKKSDAHLNFSFEKTNQRHKSNTRQTGTIDWSGLTNETISEKNKDRWPQLPKQGWEQTAETLNQPLNDWRLQEQAKFKFLSDQEQRGKLWNG